MAQKATDADDGSNRHVQTANGRSRVHVDRVPDTDVWLTEHVVDEPEGRTAPHTVRAAWRVVKASKNEWLVVPAGERRLFNGCTNGRRTATHDEHRSALRRELKHHYLLDDNTHTTTTEHLEIRFEGPDGE